ncbi:unnamed protein product [Peniophora sp. CBMAI 1063]|nr:unnamed protein product [Peniophora sp. CBMAI 1063]
MLPTTFRFFAGALLGASFALAQSNSSVVCVAGQCLEGFSNTTIGVRLNSPSVGVEVQLLPGQYSSSTNPQLLHEILTSSSTQYTPSPGFNSSSSSSPLPLGVALQPGFSIYSSPLYAGQASFAPLPQNATNTSSGFSASSLAISDGVWLAVKAGTSQSRMILWDSIPDTSQINGLTSLTLVDMQSSSCSTPCSSAGLCTTSGKCSCPTGFTGESCETCAPGFFGPTCQACPANCTSCDEGISGSGRCLTPIVSNPPSSCNCLNGQCQSNGQCTCNSGWTAASNGTACAACAAGFFLDSNGDCSKCELGCDQCESGSGICTACASGFTQDANDRTKCNAATTVTSSGTQCPDGSFSNGTACAACSTSCTTCNGPTSNDCIVCANGQYKLNGTCVTTDSNGVCSGSSMVANNNKHECDSCPSKCTSCAISGFNVASTIDQAKCTGCLPGFVLNNGQCVESCPSGTFLSPKDNLTCTACSSTCGTCAGSADFCLTCANNALASNGQCVTSCPSNTFSSSGACVACHPDCATCSGTSFSQCSSCPAERPVLSNGRCLPTCSKNQFFDTASSSCQSCDSSCSSCSGSGPSSCLACSSSSQKLSGGTCVDAKCSNSSSIISGLGVCLSDLVAVPQASGTTTPLPTISGLTAPASNTTKTTARLEWWQILLMALGCAFIFVAILWLYRRRQLKKRAQATAAFAAAKNLHRGNWRWRLAEFGQRLFGGGNPEERRQRAGLKQLKLRNAEQERHALVMGKLGGPSSLPSYHDHSRASSLNGHGQRWSGGDHESFYSQVTGLPPRAPVPRQPVRDPAPMASRFSWTTVGTTPFPRYQTEAQRYAQSVRTASPVPSEPEGERGSYWLKPNNTGATTQSTNPFRR